jgi:hypothetical protein
MLRRKTAPRFFFLGLAALGISLGFGAACVIEGDWGGIFGDEYVEDFSKTLPLSAGGVFSLKNTNGTVRVSTWTRDEVEIAAKKIAARRESDLDRVKIEVGGSADAVRVDTVYERYRNLRVKVNYEVQIPEGCRVELVRTTNGDVELTGRFDEVKASSTNGDIRLENAAVRADLSTTNGTIRALDLSGEITADTTNGGIILEFRELKADVRAGTTNGSIRIRLPEEINARLSARTTNGRITTDIPITFTGTVSSRRRLEGTLGKGGPEVRLQTTNGSITIGR